MSDRLKYLVYRCYRCGRPLSRLEILKVWEESEASNKLATGICPCGSRHVTPTNLTPEEEAKYLSDEQQKRYSEGVRDNDTRFVELYELEVRGKELNRELYPEQE